MAPPASVRSIRLPSNELKLASLRPLSQSSLSQHSISNESDSEYPTTPTRSRRVSSFRTPSPTKPDSKITSALTTPKLGPPNDFQLHQSPFHSPHRSASTQSMRSEISMGSNISTSASGSLEMQLDSLRKKLRVMEKKRKEDQEKIAKLKSENKDALKLESIVKRLQAKLLPMHEEIVKLRNKLHDLEIERAKLVQDAVSQDEMLELATLDREMAEERAEHLLDELEELRAKWEDLEVEYEALKEENALYEELRESGELGSLGESASNTETAVENARLQKKNQQLEAALLKLRDLMKDQDEKHQQEIEKLKEDAVSAKGVNSSYENAKEQLEEYEEIISELQQELDAALDNESMIEELSEKNLELTEKYEELQQTIEELETLKALNDELESSHILTEKQLMQEVDELNALNISNENRLNEAQERNSYLESAILKYRDIVNGLEEQLSELKASNQLHSADTAAMEAHKKTLIDLNSKLSNTALESRSKTMDLQIQKFQAEQSIKQLMIVKCYLSDGYENDEMSINALLRLERISFLCQVIEDFLTTRNDSTNPDTFSSLFHIKICLALVELRNYSNSLAAFMRYCTPEQFNNHANLYTIMEPVENILDTYIEILRVDELQESSFLHDLEGLLPKVWIIYDECMKEQKDTNIVSSNQNIILNNLGLIQKSNQFLKTLFQELIQLLQELSIDTSSNAVIAGVADQLSTFSKTKAYASKIIKDIHAHMEYNNMLPSQAIEKISKTSTKCKLLIQFLISLVHHFQSELNSEEVEPPQLTDEQVIQAFKEKFNDAFVIDETNNNNVTTVIEQTFHYICDHLRSVSSLTEDEYVPIKDLQSPWTIKAGKLVELKQAQAKKEEEITNLNLQVQKLATTLKTKDKSIEELEVKIALLNSKMQKSKEQTDAISELKRALSESISQEKKLKETISKLRQSLLDQEKIFDSKMKRRRGKRRSGVVGGSNSSGTFSSKYSTSNEINGNNNEEGNYNVDDDGGDLDDDDEFGDTLFDNISATALRNEIKGLRQTINFLSHHNYNHINKNNNNNNKQEEGKGKENINNYLDPIFSDDFSWLNDENIFSSSSLSTTTNKKLFPFSSTSSTTNSFKYHQKFRAAFTDIRKSLTTIDLISIKKPCTSLPSTTTTTNPLFKHSLWIPRNHEPSVIVASQEDTFSKAKMILNSLTI